MVNIVIVGGGYAGLYVAWGLEKQLKRGEARVTVLDPRPYMTYQPFLPEVVSGAIEPRHAVVPLRRHLRRTRVVAGSATAIDHDRKTVSAVGTDGHLFSLSYDIIVVTAGAVTRTFPVPGLAEEAIGLKNIEEAIAVRDRLLTAFDQAAALPPGPERARLLTVTVVGGGFSGVEGFAEILSLGVELLEYYPELERAELAFHLVEARDRILPEVTDRPGRWVVSHLRRRGGEIHLNTQVTSMVDGHVVLSDGEEFDSALIIWTAGNAANPVVSRRTDLPIDERGYLVTRSDLRIGTADHVVEDAWAAGDDAAIPDLAEGSGRLTVPNAQHAVRQAGVLADNLVATLRGRETQPYVHHSLGVVATLGRGQGLFQYKGLVIKGWLAWAMHRGYHVLAVPSFERKLRVVLGWLAAFLGRRDVASLAAATLPRRAFVSSGAPSPLAVVPLRSADEDSTADQDSTDEDSGPDQAVA